MGNVERGASKVGSGLLVGRQAKKILFMGVPGAKMDIYEAEKRDSGGICKPYPVTDEAKKRDLHLPSGSAQNRPEDLVLYILEICRDMAPKI